MIPAVIILILALVWLAWETDWFTIRLPYGAVQVVQPALAAQLIGRCGRCNGRDDVELFPVKIEGSTFTVCAACVQYYAKEIAKVDKPMRPYQYRLESCGCHLGHWQCNGDPLCGRGWYVQHKDDPYPEPEITIMYDGQQIYQNGLGPKGEVKAIVKAQKTQGAFLSLQEREELKTRG